MVLLIDGEGGSLFGVNYNNGMVGILSMWIRGRNWELEIGRVDFRLYYYFKFRKIVGIFIVKI